MLETIITELTKRTPLFVIAIGVVVFVIGAAGGLPIGEPQLEISDPAWRAGLGVMGVLLILAGLLLLKYEVPGDGEEMHPDKVKSEYPPGLYASELKSEPIAIIWVESGTLANTCFTITAAISSLTVGQESSCDITIPHGYLSRTHCRLVIEPFKTSSYKFTLHDAGSTTGTFVNNEKIKTAELEDGDRIDIAGILLRFYALA